MPGERLFAVVAPAQKARFTALANQAGVSESKLIRMLIDAALARNAVPEQRPRKAGKEPAYIPPEKYTVRLRGEDAAELERRAGAREMVASSYAGQVLRAHLRAAPPLPYTEFQTIKQLVNELGGIRGALIQLLGAQKDAKQRIDAQVIDAINKLLPVLKSAREDVQNMLAANTRSWETPSG